MKEEFLNDLLSKAIDKNGYDGLTEKQRDIVINIFIALNMQRTTIEDMKKALGFCDELLNFIGGII